MREKLHQAKDRAVERETELTDQNKSLQKKVSELERSLGKATKRSKDGDSELSTLNEEVESLQSKISVSYAMWLHVHAHKIRL